MKSPLNYQATEYDCGPTTMLNAISYLFRREEIPPDVVRHIMLYTLDTYNSKGEFGKSGTSSMAMQFLSNWLNQFGRVKRFPVQASFLEGRAVSIGPHSSIISGLQQGGAAVVRLMYGCWHYALLTGVDGEWVDLFDPYYRQKPFHLSGIELVSGEPKRRNRRVSFARLNSREKEPYALGPWDTREAVLLFNRNTRKTPEDTIEYFI